MSLGSVWWLWRTVFCEPGFSVVTVEDSVLGVSVQCSDCGGQCSVSLGSVQ